MTIATQPGIHVVETRSGPLQILALPWCCASTIMAREEYKNLSLPDLTA